MHIITGLIITKLLGLGPGGKKKKPLSPLLRLHEPVRLRHLLPGRVRFQIKLIKHNQDICRQLKEKLRQIETVELVEVNPVTGSVLIVYDEVKLPPDLLAAALIRLLGLEEELEKDLTPAAAREIKQFGKALNRVVYDRTGGLLDMKTALFILLAVVGTRKLLLEKNLSIPAGFTLLWWAGNGLMNRKQVTD